MSKASWIRIVPFSVFMGFIAVKQILEGAGWFDLSAQQLLYLYPLKIVLVGGLLIYWWAKYEELDLSDLKRIPHTAVSIVVGCLVCILWINMDWSIAAFGETTLFDPFLIEDTINRNLIIFSRIFGATLIVPIMEELFWRSFMLRYIITADFTVVKIGTFSLTSFVICAALFGLEHNMLLAGIMAGACYSLLLYWTKSISQCILAHAVNNLALGIYVLQSGLWKLW